MVALCRVLTALGQCMPESYASAGKYVTTVCKIPAKQLGLLLLIKFESLCKSRIHRFCEGNSTELPDGYVPRMRGL